MTIPAIAFDDVQSCPWCHGLIAREHFARDHLTDPILGDHLLTYLYCQYCDAGLETLWAIHGARLIEEISIEYRRSKDPVKLGRFLQRLDSTRVEAA